MQQPSGVNFINVFTCSFYAGRSQKPKKLLNLTVFWALLGSAHLKAAHKMLVKLTPGLVDVLRNILYYYNIQNKQRFVSNLTLRISRYREFLVLVLEILQSQANAFVKL